MSFAKGSQAFRKSDSTLGILSTIARNSMKITIHRFFCSVLFAAAFSLPSFAESPKFTDRFDIAKDDLSASGKSNYFILEPGYSATYEGKEDDEPTVLTITVTHETKTVDGVETRIVEEKESAGGELKEISRNYFAISKTTGNVYYFGEDSATYKNGKVSNREGSWTAGISGAHFGLGLPGKPKVGDAYYQELAPKVAMDRAEVVSVSEIVKTPVGEFKDCIKTEETSALEKGKEYKLYAPGVGLVQDAKLKLTKVSHGAK